MHSCSSSTASISDLFRPGRPKGLRSRDLSNTRLNLLKQEIQTDSHLIPLKDLYEQLGTDPNKGLTTRQAVELLEYHGYNTLTPATQYGWPLLLFKSLCTGFSLLVWFGALLCIVAYLIEASTKTHPSFDNLYLGCVLIAVDVICGLFSFYQNFKSTKIMKIFNSMIPNNTSCVRDGVLNHQTPVSVIVKGDIVHVKVGDVVPADIRVIDSKGFKVDNSSLTGESVAVPRSNCDGTVNILESPNVAFFSTLCVEGWAVGVVLCCGDLTALGRVAGLAARLQPAPSPLSRELKRFMRYMSLWALGLGFFIAAASFSLGYPFMQITIFVIGIIVANIPEGLQPTVTASLTLTAQNMVKNNCLVKNLDAIEALGACTTICSDKTGTLTENKMSVQHVWIYNKIYSVHDPELTSMLQNNQDLTTCGAICSNASILSGGVIVGDASETAILNYILQHYDPSVIRSLNPKVAEIPFNSINKYQVSVHMSFSTSKYFVVMKGAPECIFQRCATIALENNTVALTDKIKEAAEEATEMLASTGERIMAFADLYLDSERFNPDFSFDANDINFPIDGLRLLGVMGIIDPPRGEVQSAIQRVRAAGVRVMMVTGDHPATARAIAVDVGIATTSKCHVITGSELRNMTPDLLNWTLEKHYEIGVMTILCVDLGTDMWPAVSLAYERAESNVMARPPRASDPLVSSKMITLVYGHLGLIEFAAGMFAYFVVMAEHGFYPAILFGIRQRWDNEAISDVQDSYGQEWTFAERKEVERACQAAYFVAVVVTQLMNGIICKTRYNSLFHVGMKNKVLNIGLVFEILLAIAVCYVPGVNTFFRTYPLRPRWWFLALPFSALLFTFDEFRKYCIRKELFERWYNNNTYY